MGCDVSIDCIVDSKVTSGKLKRDSFKTAVKQDETVKIGIDCSKCVNDKSWLCYSNIDGEEDHS